MATTTKSKATTTKSKATATKSKATATKSKGESGKALELAAYDYHPELEETINAWAGMSKHPDEWKATAQTTEIQAIVIGNYAIYDYQRHDERNRITPWFEVWKLTTLPGSIWNRTVSAIQTYAKAMDVIDLLKAGNSAIGIQAEIDRAWQCEEYNDSVAQLIDIPKYIRGNHTYLYANRRKWVLKPLPKEVLPENSETGDW